MSLNTTFLTVCISKFDFEVFVSNTLCKRRGQTQLLYIFHHFVTEMVSHLRLSIFTIQNNTLLRNKDKTSYFKIKQI